MKPGDLYIVKKRFPCREPSSCLFIAPGKILLFIRKEIELDDAGRRRRYFFLHEEKIISFSLAYDPVIKWVKKCS